MKKILTTCTLLLCLTSCIADSTTEDDVASSFLEQGTMAPDFTISPYGSDEEYSLYQLRGRYVLVEFWAQWCPDCRNVTAEMKNLYATFADEALVFVGFSLDTDKEAWEAYITENELTWVQTCEFKEWKESDVATAYNIKWIPTFYLIDRESRVLYATIEIDDMADYLKKLLVDSIQIPHSA